MRIAVKHKLILILTIVVLSCQAQDIPFKTYTIENGLPSSKIYDIIQDTKGYIWFASDYGVSRFDGEIFKNYTTSDNLASNTIVKLFLDKHGLVYFLNAHGEINIFDQKFSASKFNKAIKENLNGEVADHFMVGPHKIDLTTSSGKNYLMKGDLVKHTNPGNKKVKDFYFLAENESYSWGKCFPSTDGKKRSTNIRQKADTIFISLENEYKEVPSISFNTINQKKEYIITLNNHLYHIQKDTVLFYEFESFINDVYIDHQNSIWISVNQKGVYQYNSTNLNEVPLHYFSNKNILKTYQDRENNYWFISDNEGIILVNTLDFKVYNNIKYNIISLDVMGDVLMFSTYENEVYECKISADKILNISKIDFENKNHGLIEDILIHEDGSFWILYSNFDEFNNYGTSFPVDLTAVNYKSTPLNKTTKRAHFIRNIEFEDSKISYTPALGIYRGKQFSINFDSSEEVWLKTLEGFFNSIGHNFAFFNLDNKEFKSQITDILSTDKFVVIGTRNSGLRITSNENKLTKIKKESHKSLPSNSIRKLYIDDSKLWIGTNNGICFVDISNITEKNVEIYPIMINSGFLYYEVSDIIKQEGILWIGGNTGLISFRDSAFNYSSPPPKLSFDRISINDIDTLVCSKYQLHPNQNTLTFHFKGISINANQNLLYKYRLVGLDSSWIMSKNSTVRYPKLLAGNYQFVVYCTSDGNNWTENAQIIEFQIRKHFTKTFLFVLLVSVLSLAIILIILKLILSSQKRKDLIEKNLLHAEISSLRSQMNPHFIYNCMNSIQGYIVRNENNLASEYIDSFARLLRTVVESSRKKFITLDQEIITLAQYLELEKLRFSWKFDYDIVIDSNVDTTAILIPPLLIQPFVENAIHHGFATLKSNSLITITVKDDELENMTVIIEDNGIGRVKARQISDKRHNHKSVGMQNIHDRIGLLNRIYSSRISLEIIDLYDIQNIACGTKVILKVPPLIKLSDYHE